MILSMFNLGGGEFILSGGDAREEVLLAGSKPVMELVAAPTPKDILGMLRTFRKKARHIPECRVLTTEGIPFVPETSEMEVRRD